MAFLSLLAGAAGAATVTIDGARTYQTIEGFGVNANHRSWNNNELKPVLDALIDQAGMTLFRVVFDNADWEGTNDNSNADVMNGAYYNTVYSNPDFQKMWDMMGYLNQKGITNGVMPNFQGFGPAWMSLPGGGYRSLAPGFENEWAEMIASALVYARYTNHLQFGLVGPNNEPDIPGSGIGIADGRQYATTLHKLAQQLDANGLSDMRFVGPDLSNSDTNWLPEIMSDPLVMAKLGHFGLHSYSAFGTKSEGVADFIAHSAYPDRTFWMTEFNVWCDVCQYGTQGTNSWEYFRGTAENLLYHLANNASAGLVWEAYDSHYYNTYDSNMHWSFWGLFALNNTNAVPPVYTPRKNFYTMAQISKFVRPGARRIDVSSSSSLLLLAFYHPDSGQLTLTGVNRDTAPVTLSGTLASLPGINSLDLYYTSSTADLQHGTAVPIVNGTFSLDVPADCVFTLTGFVPASITIQTQPAGEVVRNGAAATLSVAATGTAPLSYQWQRNGVSIAGATTPSLTFSSAQAVNAGNYRVVLTSTAASLTSSNALLLVDMQPPKVTVSAPRAGQRLLGAAGVSGKASDDVQVAAVFCQINQQDWVAATGTSNWSAMMNLEPGPNVLRVYALDGVGNTSATNAVSFTYVLTSPLTLMTNGLGRISSNFRGSLLEVGRSYTVIAVPGAGQVFSNWDGTVSSSNAMLNFIMQSNMVLQANFIPNPFLRAKGAYQGLFQEANRVHEHSGFVSVTVTDRGTYTGILRRGANSFPLRGKFDVAGRASNTIPGAGANPWTVAMALDLAGTAERLEGTVGDGLWVADLVANRDVFDARSSPASLYAGRYTMNIPGADDATVPGGDGYSMVLVDASGNVTVLGSLADGSVLSQKTTLSRNGEWPLYVPVNSGKGSVLGWITNEPAAALQGGLSWIKTAQSMAQFYPAGFSNLVAATGSRYAPPARLTPVISLTNGGVVTFEGGSLSMPVTNLVTLTPANQVIDGSLSNKLSLALNLSSGLFRGSVIPAGTTRRLSFQGALFQDLGVGRGYFLGTNASGRVYFGP